MTLDWDFDTVCEHLRLALRGSLPGGRAQMRMAPVPRPGWDPEAEAPRGRPAAVLVLLYPVAAGDGRREPTLLLTERTETMELHRGQIAFPGGCAEEGESPEDTALREAHEEAAVSPDRVRLLGRLSRLWIPASGYLVTPVVGVTDERPPLRPDPTEVARLLEVPLRELLDPRTLRTEGRSRDGRWQTVRYFAIGEARLWGATAMMTAELLTLLGW